MPKDKKLIEQLDTYEKQISRTIFEIETGVLTEDCACGNYTSQSCSFHAETVNVLESARQSLQREIARLQAD